MRTPLKVGDRAPNFQFNTPWTTSSQDFHETTRHQQAVLVFLRYHGCPVCQMEMANLKNDIELFHRKEARVFVILQSATSTLRPLLKEEDWPFAIVCDPKGTIFELYAVEPGGIVKYLHPAGLVAGFKAMSRGFFHKKFEGKETQLPAAFIIQSDMTVKYAYYGKNISDVPKPSILAENCD
ncbi:MAG: redoxin domain-containing protein [Thermodesulfobacteriota bacterium]|nr:redoxin domain-containing protein [Thermodesulfobacteriota bacterium]